MRLNLIARMTVKRKANDRRMPRPHRWILMSRHCIVYGTCCVPVPRMWGAKMPMPVAVAVYGARRDKEDDGEGGEAELGLRCAPWFLFLFWFCCSCSCLHSLHSNSKPSCHCHCHYDLLLASPPPPAPPCCCCAYESPIVDCGSWILRVLSIMHHGNGPVNHDRGSAICSWWAIASDQPSGSGSGIWVGWWSAWNHGAIGKAQTWPC